MRPPAMPDRASGPILHSVDRRCGRNRLDGRGADCSRARSGGREASAGQHIRAPDSPGPPRALLVRHERRWRSTLGRVAARGVLDPGGLRRRRGTRDRRGPRGPRLVRHRARTHSPTSVRPMASRVPRPGTCSKTVAATSGSRSRTRACTGTTGPRSIASTRRWG